MILLVAYMLVLVVLCSKIPVVTPKAEVGPYEAFTSSHYRWGIRIPYYRLVANTTSVQRGLKFEGDKLRVDAA